MNDKPEAPALVIGRSPVQRRLPYVLSIPAPGGQVFLATSAPWPPGKDAFCLELQAWPDDAEVVERLPVARCARKGRALHVTLERRSRRRCMFVWVESKGRRMVFWRTRQTVKQLRPGLRVPETRRADVTLRLAVDVRERYPWTFEGKAFAVERRELPCGDYAVLDGDRIMVAVERKTPSDLLSACINGSLSFALGELSGLPRGALVVEGRMSQVLKPDAPVDPGWLLQVFTSLQATYPRVPWLFAETSGLAESVAGHWLQAAAAAVRDEAKGHGSGGDPERHRRQVRVGPAADADRGPRSVTARRRQSIEINDRSSRLDAAIGLAREGRRWTAKGYAEHMDVSMGTAYGDLNELAEAGSLVRESGRPAVYARPESGGSGRVGGGDGVGDRDGD